MDLTDLTKQNPDVADKVSKLYNRSMELDAPEGAQRLALVAENITRLSLEEAHRLLDPNAFQCEVEEAQAPKNKVGGWRFFRNILSLAPLILTWVGLFLASSAYQQYGVNHPKDLTETFLQLWQEKFHNIVLFGLLPSGLLPTFAEIAILDVILLVLLLCCIVRIQMLEHKAWTISRQFSKELQVVTEGIMKIVAVEGVTPISTQADIDKVVRAIRQTVAGAFHASEQAAERAKDAVLQSHQMIEKTLDKFSKDVEIFHLDLDKLNNHLNNYQSQVDRLTQASKEVADASTNLANNAGQYTQVGKDIDQHIVELKQTGKEMATTIDAGQQKVAAEITTVAQSMNGASGKVEAAARDMAGAATDVKAVSDQLVTLKSSDISAITSGVRALAIQTANVVQSLAEVEVQLRGTTAQLKAASDRLAIVSDSRYVPTSPPDDVEDLAHPGIFKRFTQVLTGRQASRQTSKRQQTQGTPRPGRGAYQARHNSAGQPGLSGSAEARFNQQGVPYVPNGPQQNYGQPPAGAPGSRPYPPGQRPNQSGQPWKDDVPRTPRQQPPGPNGHSQQ